MYTAEDVAAGRRLVAETGKIQWALGDLAVKVAPYIGDGMPDQVLAKFAEEIGVGRSTLSEYRRMAVAWPPEKRVPGATWTLHRELAAEPQRVAALRAYVRDTATNGVKPSYRGLQVFLGHRPTLEIAKGNLETQVRQGLNELPMMVRMQILKELLASEDDTTRMMGRDREPAAPARPRPPVYIMLGRASRRFATEVERLLSDASELPPDEGFWLAAGRDRAGAAVAAIGDYIDHNGTDGRIDAELAEVMRDRRAS
jgi:hypothetical protein